MAPKGVTTYRLSATRLGSLSRADFLDIACGTGELAGAAARRGTHAHGVGFADAMVASARAKYPAVDLRVGDAQDLPEAEASFDAVTCAFGVPRFADPERALRSARRVPRSGGRFALTPWCGPQHGLQTARGAQFGLHLFHARLRLLLR